VGQPVVIQGPGEQFGGVLGEVGDGEIRAPAQGIRFGWIAP
jgi:hypothetical protein